MTLDDWMTERGLTDAALAAQISVTRSQINRIRRGKSRPSIDVAKQLERVTRIPAAKFVMGEAAPHQDAAA